MPRCIRKVRLHAAQLTFRESAFAWHIYQVSRVPVVEVPSEIPAGFRRANTFWERAFPNTPVHARQCRFKDHWVSIELRAQISIQDERPEDIVLRFQVAS